MRLLMTALPRGNPRNAEARVRIPLMMASLPTPYKRKKTNGWSKSIKRDSYDHRGTQEAIVSCY